MEAKIQEPEVAPLDRRAVLASLTTLGAFAGLTTQAAAQSGGGTDPVARLLGRITYGVSAQDLADARRMGFTAYVERQLTMTEADDRLCENEVKRRWPRVFMNAKQLANVPEDWQTAMQLQESTLYRMIFSKRQLYTRMCEFWREHFSMFIWKTGSHVFVDDQNNVIRRHALGKFPDMLWASAHSAAMMLYLDNAYSYGGNPNQNYAREIMELHTLSVTGGYTQRDVIEVADCFTGWSYEWESSSPNHMKFLYRNDWHADGQKIVLGRTIPAGGGKRDAETVLRILANHPNTAKFIAKKLVQWFLGEGTWTALETQVANTYLRTGGDIKAMLRVILTSGNILAAKPKLKKPAHLYVSCLRALNIQFNAIDWTRWYTVNAGHELFSWAPPNGYPDKNTYWAGLILNRWNYPLDIMGTWWTPQFRYDLNRLLGPTPNGTTLVAAIERVFFSGQMPKYEKDRLLRYVAGKTIDEWNRRSTIALAMCTPAFQLM